MNLPSKILEQAVNEFSRLPGVGRKTALRYALFLVRMKTEALQQWSETITRLAEDINYCKICFAISENEICEICGNPSRDHSLLCIIEDIQDLIAIENTSRYRGVYHILGGIISPVQGIGP